jgi:ribosome-binding protein aMBF1 (putative translation factor)
MKVNDEIRRVIREAIDKLPVSQAEFARQIGVKPTVLNRALLHQGKTPEVWEAMFNGLGLELTVKPKPGAGGQE